MRSATDNVSDNNCGAINIDSCRIMCEDLSLPKYTEGRKAGWRCGENFVGGTGCDLPTIWTPSKEGRFPANFILSESVVGELDKQSLSGGMHSAGHAKPHDTNRSNGVVTSFGGGDLLTNGGRYGDNGGASRFFRVIK